MGFTSKMVLFEVSKRDFMVGSSVAVERGLTRTISASRMSEVTPSDKQNKLKSDEMTRRDTNRDF